MTDDASPENLRKFLESDDPAMRRMGLPSGEAAAGTAVGASGLQCRVGLGFSRAGPRRDIIVPGEIPYNSQPTYGRLLY